LQPGVRSQAFTTALIGAADAGFPNASKTIVAATAKLRVVARVIMILVLTIGRCTMHRFLEGNLSQNDAENDVTRVTPVPPSR
jgi:hypothetical protein